MIGTYLILILIGVHFVLSVVLVYSLDLIEILYNGKEKPQNVKYVLRFKKFITECR